MLPIKLYTDLPPHTFSQLLASKGYTHLTLQTGSGKYEPTAIKDVHIEFYSYKKSLEEDMTASSLIISHGGTGVCMCMCVKD